MRSVTYCTFGPGDHGHDYPSLEVVEEDFAAIAGNGMNEVRTYSMPPEWLLDTPQEHGLRIMVGIPWEQHIAFLDDKQRARTRQPVLLDFWGNVSLEQTP